MRNIDKQALCGQKIAHGTRDITVNEMHQLFDEMTGTKEAAYNTLLKAFYFGAAVGYIQAKEQPPKALQPLK